MKKIIDILDYGMGNIGSIANMLNYLGAKFRIISTYEEVDNSNALILPGVGKFDAAIKILENKNIFKSIVSLSDNKSVPILGICLGMQLLCRDSEEGQKQGLGLIDASVTKLDTSRHKKLKIPHMGWNYVNVCGKDNILANFKDQPRFYFVHSFCVKTFDESIVIGKTNYSEEFVSAFQRDNIIGLQFHPEKSHEYGMQVFRNFIKLTDE
tara:strand:+ start:5216 stop:5845 length:630 start_codon:yes stop_codon:yes gene_type:complete